jgi:ribonuclease HI
MPHPKTSAHQMPTATIFCDGACSGNPGPGGWGAILLVPSKSVEETPGNVTPWDAKIIELGGGPHFETTNNQMELLATREALKRLGPLWPSDAGPIHVYTDSSYVIFGITRWIFGWKKRNWQTQEGASVLNRELWESLDRIVREVGATRIRWGYVRGHTGIDGNERVDQIAVAYSKGQRIELYAGSLAEYSVPLLPLHPCVDPPERTQKTGSAIAGGQAPWYLSMIHGNLEKHTTWAQCESRVKGVAGAKFKKVSTPEEEATIKKKWGL